MIVSWFSAGVSSAVATKIAIKKYGDVHIRYHHIDDQHPDTLRFLKDCEAWFGIQINIDQSPYKTVENVCRAAAFLVGPHGAACSRLLKKRQGKLWEIENPGRHTYVWGLDAKEKNRKDGFIRAMPHADHFFPLIELGLNKKEIHGMLEAAGIKRPAMYDLGYQNNNCIGCLRGGMWYFNKIRKDFPEVFDARAKLERLIGHSCIMEKQKDGTKKELYLDELAPDRGRAEEEIIPDCGMFCEIQEAHPCAGRPPQDTAETGSTYV